MAKGTLLFSILLVIFVGRINAQCHVKIIPGNVEICTGDTITMRATGGCGIPFFTDFNDSTLQNLLSNNNVIIGTPCSNSLDNSYYAWLGNLSGQSIVYTPQINLVAGGYTLYFDMKYGEDGAGGSCDGPAALSESVYLQYSTNNGATWTVIQFWDPNGGHDPVMTKWKTYSISIPSAANTAGTRFRWAQLSSLPANTACWGIDNIYIQNSVPTQFLWSTGQTSQVHPKISPIATTKYYLTASYGFTSTVDSATITVNSRPIASFSTTRPLCKNEMIDLIYNGPPDTISTYHWYVQKPTFVSDTLTAHAKALWNKTGQYNVTLVLNNTKCNTLPAKKDLLISPLISFYISASQGCAPLEIQYTGNVNPSGSSYLWDFKDGSTSNVDNPTHIYTTAGDYGLSLISTTDSGCTDTANFALLTRVFPLPEVNFSHAPLVIPWSNPLASFQNLTNGGSTYYWEFGDPASGSNNSTAFNPQHSYSAKGLYDVWLIATTDKGCVDSITKPIRVADDEFDVPNVITPNGDGFNETLKISNFESLKECRIEIYNRWGKLIYKSDNYRNDWNANDVADGVYYYILQYSSWFGDQNQHGIFHVLKH